jgi:hypothetical protein
MRKRTSAAIAHLSEFGVVGANVEQIKTNSMEQKDFFEGLTLKQIIKYAVVYPLGLILMCGIAGWLESLWI